MTPKVTRDNFAQLAAAKRNYGKNSFDVRARKMDLCDVTYRLGGWFARSR
jgi:hypothetical protein